MAYSSIAQIRANDAKFVNSVDITDAIITDRIDEADQQIEIDLSNVVDFTLVTDTPVGCPDYINKLSKYKATELTLVYYYGAKREAEVQTDRQYWANLYKLLLDKILAGEIALGTPGTMVSSFTYDVKEDVKPALGMGEQGGFIDESDLEDQRDFYSGD